jgi:glutathione S-transferase
MQLYFSPNSPFVRKVMVTAHEVGVADRMQVSPTDVWAPNPPVAAANPLGQIPTLVCEDGTVLYDSGVICEFLDEAFGDGRLMPPQGAARWRLRRLEALGNGLLNAAVTRTLELRRRPSALRWEDLLARQQGIMRRCYDALETEAGGFDPAAPDLAQIATACALAYVDRRLPEDGWREGRPALAGWFASFAERESFAGSAPAVLQAEA